MLYKNQFEQIEQIFIASDDSKIFSLFQTYPGEVNDLQLKISEISPIFNNNEMKVINGISYLNIEILKIVDDNTQEQKKYKSDIIMYKRLNKERLSTIFNCLGFNITSCIKMTDEIFSILGTLIHIKYEDLDTNYCIKTNIIVKQNIFYMVSKNIIKAVTGSKCRMRKYFNLSYLLISNTYINLYLDKTIPIIILIGGTSGTGKSTVSSLLASRLGISTVISTDTIRHIMRNFFTKEEFGILFSSTYDAWERLPNEDLTKIPISKRTIKGYKAQSELVGKKLVSLIEKILKRHDSVIIEGVHLTANNIKMIMRKYKYTFPFFVFIDKAETHKERFAVRSKLMTLDARFNKYVEHFEHIRAIQSYLIKKADQFLLPKIDNTNIDKSICIIQETILRSFKDIYVNNLLNYDEIKDNLSNHFNNFSKLCESLISSKEANSLILQKINKNLVLEKNLSYCPNDNAVNVGKIEDNLNNYDVNYMDNYLPISPKIQYKNESICDMINDSNYKYESSYKPYLFKNESASDDETENITKIKINKNSKNYDSVININHACNFSKINCDNIENNCNSNINANDCWSDGNYFDNNNLIGVINDLKENNYDGPHRDSLLRSNDSKSASPSKNKLSVRNEIEKEDKELALVTSGSLYKLGSIDSESGNDRIKVINETEDDLESIDEIKDFNLIIDSKSQNYET